VIPADLGAVGKQLPEPLLLVTGSGEIVDANAAAVALIGGELRGRRLDDVLPPQDGRINEFLSVCSRSRALLPGALVIGSHGGQPRLVRCQGAVLAPRNGSNAAVLLVRLQPDDPASSRFVALTRKIDELTREMRIRSKVEQERAALLAQERQLRLELELQATELEQQSEEAQQLSEELEYSNDELSRALAAAEHAWRAAEAANRVKAEFLATMSHELRTPINATLGYVELLALGLRGVVSAEQLADLERIRRNQQHLLGVITNILNFSRVEVGQIEFGRERVILEEVLDSVGRMLDPLGANKRLDVKVLECPGGVVAMADRGKVEQILVNLLSNAMKFSPIGARIVVSCEEGEERHSVHVQDWGIGIPEDKLEVIFEPFVQLDSSLARNAGGAGLGLSISREFARRMGGDLRVSSAPAVGSTFTLTLPRAVDD
jgi:signal transduction histidine kinase